MSEPWHYYVTSATEGGWTTSKNRTRGSEGLQRYYAIGGRLDSPKSFRGLWDPIMTGYIDHSHRDDETNLETRLYLTHDSGQTR
jgi:hypothetical protein